ISSEIPRVLHSFPTRRSSDLRLPLVKESLRMLVEQLGPHDTVAIAVYAGASGTVLEPTNDKAAIRAALDRLEAGGSTNGAAGVRDRKSTRLNSSHVKISYAVF